MSTPTDCKCGAKYVTGLRSLENGQMVDDSNQFTCFRCYNEQNAARLRMEDAACRLANGTERKADENNKEARP
jgi:hypothetical protein